MLLRQPIPADIPVIIGWVNDKNIAAKMFKHRVWAGNPYTIEEMTGILSKMIKNDTPTYFVIQEKSGKLIGFVAIDLSPNKNSFAIFIAKTERGKGYGYEASKVAIGFWFDKLNLKTIQAKVWNVNTASIALLKKLRFKQQPSIEEKLGLPSSSPSSNVVSFSLQRTDFG